MPTSDEELQKQSERVQKLREQVAEAEAKRVEREREVANDITMAQLKAEEAQLEARLTVAREAGKVNAVKAGVAAPLDAAKEALERAVKSKESVEASRESADAPAAANGEGEGN